MAIEEIEIATKQLKSAYISVFNKFARITKNPDLKINSSNKELKELNTVRERFDIAGAHMDKIAEEIINWV